MTVNQLQNTRMLKFIKNEMKKYVRKRKKTTEHFT